MKKLLLPICLLLSQGVIFSSAEERATGDKKAASEEACSLNTETGHYDLNSEEYMKYLKKNGQGANAEAMAAAVQNVLSKVSAAQIESWMKEMDGN